MVPGPGLAVTAGRDRLRPIEWLLLAYLGVTSVTALVRWPGQPAMAWVILSNILIACLMALVRFPGPGPVGWWVRELYPMLLLAAFYPALDLLNNFGGVSVHDTLVRRWEIGLFAGEPAREWWQRSPSQFWSATLHAAYLGYYPIVAAPVLVFLARRRLVAARRAVSWIVATFLVCYMVFLFFPVAGPYYEYPRPDAAFVANPMARLVYATLARGSAYGAAFPSSHVAATLVATAAAFLGDRRLGLILILPAVLLTVGVVYCQMHYAVDMLAGIAVAAGVIASGLAVERARNAQGNGI